MLTDGDSRDADAAQDGVASAELSRALATYHAIQSALGVRNEDPPDASGGLELPLGDLLELLPRHYRRVQADPSPPNDKTITIPVDDLYAQLARGRVAIPIARLLFAAPP